jgi:NTP pyrophosphatase (non-canonical NTP hydrolase)
MPTIGLGGEAAEVVEVLERAGLTTKDPGLAVRIGKVLERIKKHVYHRKPLDVKELAKELGDAQWYLAVLANSVGISLSTVMEINLEKLQVRYPSGKGSVTYLQSRLPRAVPRKATRKPRKRK